MDIHETAKVRNLLVFFGFLLNITDLLGNGLQRVLVGLVCGLEVYLRLVSHHAFLINL